jgi:hypothetical protein
MRKAIFGLALFGAVIVGTSVQADGLRRPDADSLPGGQADSLRVGQADSLQGERAMLLPVYWGDDCGPRCREYRWREHERWEAHRRWERHRWEERHYGYDAYPQY